MKLVSYNKDEQDQLAILADGLLYDTDLMHPDLPVGMSMFLNYWDDVYTITAAINKKLEEGKVSRQQGLDVSSVEILAPVPHTASFRVAYASLQHLALSGNSNSGILKTFEQYPVFYFSNHNCFQGPGKVVCMPDHLHNLDFQGEVAIVINKAGKNIKAEEADDFIGGYMILNGLRSRHSLPVEGSGQLLSAVNGFATPVGPMLVTPDELEGYAVECKPDHTGNAYNLSIEFRVNDVLISEGSLADMDWTFAEIIQQASYGVQLYPGDIISSGPIGTGSFLAFNAMHPKDTPDHTPQWLQQGDVVEIEIEGLGKLTNTIVKDENEFTLVR